MSDKQCTACGGNGHRASQCPWRNYREKISTRDLVDEVIRRLNARNPIRQKMDHDRPETWSDSFIAKGCLHDPSAPKELIELKRFHLFIRGVEREMKFSTLKAGYFNERKDQ